jgi:hypothetical protein
MYKYKESDFDPLLPEKWIKGYIREIQFYHNNTRKLLKIKKKIPYISYDILYIALDLNTSDLINIVFMRESMLTVKIIQDVFGSDVFKIIQEETKMYEDELK